ncbi:MAG: hypothetical protein CFE45_09430, partial [Burkholderiales bacterium PBB5]
DTPAGLTAATTPHAANSPVRAGVLGLSRPADWDRLRQVWQAVQQDLGLPAPAIAINGLDGLQLWFALAEPVPAAQAHGFLHGLRQQHLGDVPDSRVQIHPAAGQADSTWATEALPGRQVRPGQWSAFVAPDLAPVFAAQAGAGLAQAQGAAPVPTPTQARHTGASGAYAATGDIATAPNDDGTGSDPGAGDAAAPARADARRFLLAVMNDTAVDLALRIEAAKALLAHGSAPAPHGR